MRKYFPKYEEAVSHYNCSILNFPIYEKNLIFFFFSSVSYSDSAVEMGPLLHQDPIYIYVIGCTVSLNFLLKKVQGLSGSGFEKDKDRRSQYKMLTYKKIDL
jgi:hypothetical protein